MDFLKRYILTTFRLIVNRWWLSLFKIFSLTTGILSLLLVWLFYIDHESVRQSYYSIFSSCDTDTALILSGILIVNFIIYLYLSASQLHLRYNEFFFRRLYGESGLGLVIILILETTVFISVSFLISLVLIDWVAPMFNVITSKSIDPRHVSRLLDYSIIFTLFILMELFVGLFLTYFCSRNSALNLLKKIRE